MTHDGGFQRLVNVCKACAFTPEGTAKLAVEFDKALSAADPGAVTEIIEAAKQALSVYDKRAELFHREHFPDAMGQLADALARLAPKVPAADCGRCKGSGVDPRKLSETCSVCGGDGKEKR
jgi:hypothetical protein